MRAIKKIIAIGLLITLPFIFSGCRTVSLLALGSQPMPVMHEPRTDKGTSSETVISTNLSGTTMSKSKNTKDISTIGGNVDVTYRGGNWFSWLFVNGSVSGFYGKLKLTCDEADCNSDFRSLVNKGRSYSVASIQEGARAGIDFNPLFLTFGVSAGIHSYQDFLEYEDLRNDLQNTADVIGNESYNIFTEFRTWLGFRLGSAGRYGTINVELTLQAGDYFDNLLMLSLGYFHPSGWHVGLIQQSNPLILTVGKSFKF